MKRSLVASAAGLLLSGSALAADPAIPHFVEETKSAGIGSVYAGEWQYMVGGGATVFDCNGDGFQDLLLAGGEGKASFYRNRSPRGGALRFEKSASGLELDHVTGAYPLDIDSDGQMDVVLLRVGENVAMRGLGDCRFERANEAWGFDGGDGWSAAFAATWERDAKWPTLAVGNYIDRTQELEPWGSCTDNWLHRPDASQAKFAGPLALKPSFCPLSMLFTDWNNSGTPDLRVSNDREYYEGGQEQMWHVPPGQPPSLYTEAEGWKYLRIWGMGIAAYDFNGDGYQEYFLTSMADNKLQTLDAPPAAGKPARPGYKDIAYPKGVTAHRPFEGADLKPSTAWHTQIEDVNNDGLADIFIAKGNVAKMPDFAMKDPNNLLLQGDDGKFHEAAGVAGVDSTANSRGAQLADFNLDGLLDLVVVNRWESAQLWRNVSTDAGHFVSFRLNQPAPNRDGIGAWVEVKAGERVMRREITVGGGHASGQAGWIHFGIGPAEAADIRVKWPGGGWSAAMPVKAGSFSVIDRATGKADPWTPPQN